MEQKKKRGENWSSEEKVCESFITMARQCLYQIFFEKYKMSLLLKEILRHIIAQSAYILEDKSNKTSANILKSKEWKNVADKFNELTGKTRSDGEVKLAWKRMKLSAKSNLSAHRREQLLTGGGEKPPSPSPEDLQVASIAPHDFVIEVNDYDSDAVISNVALTIPASTADPKPGTTYKITDPTPINFNEENTEYHNVDVQERSNNEGVQSSARMVISHNNTNETGKPKSKKKSLQNRTEEMRQLIVQNNTDFKKKQIEIMEVEHNYNIKIAKLKIKKLELEIALLENETNEKNLN